MTGIYRGYKYATRQEAYQALLKRQRAYQWRRRHRRDPQPSTTTIPQHVHLSVSLPLKGLIAWSLMGRVIR